MLIFLVNVKLTYFESDNQKKASAACWFSIFNAMTHDLIQEKSHSATSFHTEAGLVNDLREPQMAAGENEERMNGGGQRAPTKVLAVKP